jgi:hypothetical protein
VPYNSALATGLQQSGLGSTYAFTPDVTGTYLLLLTVTGTDGTTATDSRCFTVKRSPSGRYIVSFTATAPMLNYAGQTRGWAPSMEGWLTYLDSMDAPVRFGIGTASATLTSPLQRIIYTDTSSGSPTLATITLPSVANAVDGQYVEFHDETGMWATNPLTIAANSTQNLVQQGASFGTVAASQVLNIARSSIAWRYSAPAKLWLPA